MSSRCYMASTGRRAPGGKRALSWWAVAWQTSSELVSLYEVVSLLHALQVYSIFRGKTSKGKICNRWVVYELWGREPWPASELWGREPCEVMNHDWKTSSEVVNLWGREPWLASELWGRESWGRESVATFDYIFIFLLKKWRIVVDFYRYCGII